MRTERPIQFDPNTNEHLEWSLKLAYRYATGDMDVGQEECTDALCDALCNLIGDEAFQDFVNSSDA